MEEAHAAEGVLDVRIYREPGHPFGPLLRGADRAGAVIASARAATTPSSALARPPDEIRFDVE